MKTYEFNEFLKDNSIDVFSLAEASRIIGKPEHYTSLFLKRNKSVKRALKGLYYFKGADVYGVASRVIYPSYISLISAFRIYNITDQIPNIIYVVSSKRHAGIENIDGYKVKFKTVKPNTIFGYGKLDGIFVAEPEKAAIDMIYLNEFVEYAEEAAESGKLNFGKLHRYAAITGRKKIIAWVERMQHMVEKNKWRKAKVLE